MAVNFTKCTQCDYMGVKTQAFRHILVGGHFKEFLYITFIILYINIIFVFFRNRCSRECGGH